MIILAIFTILVPLASAQAAGAGAGDDSSSVLFWIIAIGAASWALRRLWKRGRRTGQRREERQTSTLNRRPADRSRHDADEPSVTIRMSVNGTDVWEERLAFQEQLPSTNAPDARTAGKRCWVPKGQSIQVAGYSIADGMVYVGESLPIIHGWGNDNCLINPALKVARRAPDLEGRTVGYYPSYERLIPEARLAYLQWLSTGKCHPDVSIGYVFLYFYGLERRLLGERVTKEAESLLAEVERLRGIYAKINRSFDSYSAALLDVGEMIFTYGRVAEQEPWMLSKSRGISLQTRVAIARLVMQGQPIPGQWMFAWYMEHPEIRLGVTATRAQREFQALMRLRFEKQYPQGMRIRMPKQRLHYTYRAASGTFSVNLDQEIGEFPDIAGLLKPINDMHQIAETCVKDLDDFSRFIGKYPERRDSLEALAFLPKELAASCNNKAVMEVRSWLERDVKNCLKMLPVETLASYLGITIGENITKQHMRRIAAILQGLGYGVEPDPAYDPRTPKIGEHVVVFPLPGESDQAGVLSEDYKRASLLVSLAALVVHADNEVTEEEERKLMTHVESALHLPEAERIRLEAHLHRMLASPMQLNALRRQLIEIPEERRQEVARFAVSMTGADGHVDAAEIKLLQKLYKTIGLEEQQVFSTLHALSTEPGGPATEPVTIRPLEPASQGYRIPKPIAENRPAGALNLNQERVRKVLEDTQRVSEVLGTVFAEEEAAQQPEPATVQEPEETPLGPFAALDQPYRRLAALLIERQEWSREEYEKLAQSLDLMPDGALETLNEWAFEQFDEALIEEGDPLMVNRYVLGNNAE